MRNLYNRFIKLINGGILLEAQVTHKKTGRVSIMRRRVSTDAFHMMKSLAQQQFQAMQEHAQKAPE